MQGTHFPFLCSGASPHIYVSLTQAQGVGGPIPTTVRVEDPPAGFIPVGYWLDRATWMWEKHKIGWSSKYAGTLWDLMLEDNCIKKRNNLETGQIELQYMTLVSVRAI